MRKFLLMVTISTFCLFGNASSLGGSTLEFNVGIIKTDAIEYGKRKHPPRIPVICQDNHILGFQLGHPEYIINIVQNEEVLFSSIIPVDITQYELPEYICGVCIIQIVKDNYCFWTEIVL